MTAFQQPPPLVVLRLAQPLFLSRGNNLGLRQRRDDLAWAAIWLHRLTREDSYLQEAAVYYQRHLDVCFRSQKQRGSAVPVDSERSYCGILFVPLGTKQSED